MSKRAPLKIMPLFENSKAVPFRRARILFGVSLANWLREEGWSFCLRLKKNEFIETENQVWSHRSLGVKPGISLLSKNVKVTKTKQISGFNAAGKWQKKSQAKATKEGWFIFNQHVLFRGQLCCLAGIMPFDIEEMSRFKEWWL
jgi:hypothetical protein